jgi:hypothetical protein
MDQSDEVIRTYGITPPAEKRPEILKLLLSELDNESSDSNEYLKTLCILLYSIGDVQDSINIWNAKNKSFDAFLYIDVQLLTGAGLDETKTHLLSINDENAKEAHAYLVECEEAGDFVGLNKSDYLETFRIYFGLD